MDGSAPLPFDRLCVHLKALLEDTGRRRRTTIENLLGRLPRGQALHVATSRMATPAGRLDVQLLNHPNEGPRLWAALRMDQGMRYSNGTLHVPGVALSATARAAVVGLPLSAVVETPAGFPGRHAPILRVRALIHSTRITITDEWERISLDEIGPAAGRRRR